MVLHSNNKPNDKPNDNNINHLKVLTESSLNMALSQTKIGSGERRIL